MNVATRMMIAKHADELALCLPRLGGGETAAHTEEHHRHSRIDIQPGRLGQEHAGELVSVACQHILLLQTSLAQARGLKAKPCRGKLT
jgi:hypothetical protein